MRTERKPTLDYAAPTPDDARRGGGTPATRRPPWVGAVVLLAAFLAVIAIVLILYGLFVWSAFRSINSG